MMPNALINTNLSDALHTFISQIDERLIKIQLYTHAMDSSNSKHIETVLYRIIQECVNNVLKHAGASVLDIALLQDDSGISATIEDNGVGFEKAQLVAGKGIGIKNMKSRIQLLKGTIEFVSTPGEGTLVSLHIPK